MASHAYEYADAMLAARGTTDHDAAPAAVPAEPAAGEVHEEGAASGTGDTRAATKPAAWGVYRGDDLVTACKSPEVVAAWMSAWPERNYRAVPLYAAPPAAGPTLTDAEREMLTHVRDIFAAREDNLLAFAIDALLARAAKEDAR
jgi:hypothetical protein